MSGEESDSGVEIAQEGQVHTVADVEAWTDSRTFWTRLEPRTRDPSVGRPLLAEIHDPAWMLCRQWQVGEFRGEDAGSPVAAEVSYARDALSRYQLGGIEASEVFPTPGDVLEDVTVTDDVGLPPGTSGTVPVDRELTQLDALMVALSDHREQQRQGGGAADPADAAFEEYLRPRAGRDPADRRAALTYLRTPLLDHPDRDATVTFFDRARAYVGGQPTGEVTVGTDSVGRLLAELEAYADGAAGWQAPYTTFRVLVAAGTTATTEHLQAVVGFAATAAAEYETRQSAGGGNQGGQGGSDPDRTVSGDARDYEGGPLEALVERESVATALDDGEQPPARLRAEAGQAFLRFLADADVRPAPDETYGVADFADEDDDFVLSRPDEPLDGPGRRFSMVTDGRTLDGHRVYRRLVDAVGRIRQVDGWQTPDWPTDAATVDRLPLPSGESVTDDFRKAAKRYVDWYAELYDEPRGPESAAWEPDRLEHQFAVSTGPASGETVFKAEEYPGGDLDWYSFSVASGPLDSLDPPTAAESERPLTERPPAEELTPAHVRYPGMPVPRWWEFEDAEVSLEDIPAGPENLTQLLLLDFNLVYGNDWYLIPLEVPVGTMTRITDFTVTDTFGQTTDIDPVTTNTDRWNMFMFEDLPETVTDTAEGEPGLFLPPTLGDSLSSDPVERVYFSRDEMANLAFGVEELVESPVGDPLNREEFRRPELVVEGIDAGTDVDDESVELRNPGDAPLDVQGWVVELAVEDGAGGTTTAERHTFPDRALDPEESVTIHTGSAPAGATGDEADVYLDRPDPVWGSDGGSVTVRRPDEDGDPRFVTRELVTRPDESLPDYALATDVPDHWHPLKPVRPKAGSEADAGHPDTYRLALALLLDADTMDAPTERIPTPVGRILNARSPLRIHEEEVTRAGSEVVRHYQLARWYDGTATSTHLWSSRRASTGRGEAASRLRYDVLSEPDSE